MDPPIQLVLTAPNEAISPMMVRLPMLQVLIGRELKRLQKNPSALLMLGLLSAIALLMATSKPVQEAGPPKAKGFWIYYDKETPWLAHLKEHPLNDPPVHVLSQDQIQNVDARGRPVFAPGHCGIAVKHQVKDGQETAVIVAQFFGKSPDILYPFWNWFWPEVAKFQTPELNILPFNVPMAGRAPSLEETPLSELVKTELVGTLLLLIVMFFTCCHLQVSFTSQDRERGTLTALVLSPARLSEIMLSKYIFHLTLSLLGCVAVIAIMQPASLLSPVLWIVVVLTSIGLMSVGTCIATLTKTQAAAALLALCYMLAGSLLFYLSTKFSGFMLIRRAAFENYSFLLLYHALKGPLSLGQASGLVTMSGLVVVWIGLARTTFYRYGWR